MRAQVALAKLSFAAVDVKPYVHAELSAHHVFKVLCKKKSPAISCRASVILNQSSNLFHDITRPAVNEASQALAAMFCYLIINW